MTTREARLQRALLLGDTTALWTLVRERNSDDVALQSARKLLPLAATSADWKDLAATFLAHRQFADASDAPTGRFLPGSQICSGSAVSARPHSLSEPGLRQLPSMATALWSLPFREPTGNGMPNIRSQTRSGGFATMRKRKRTYLQYIDRFPARECLRIRDS